MDTREDSRRRAANKRRAPVNDQRRRRAAQTRGKTNRVVRPPKEEIPEVVYTMPKPFHRNAFLLKLATVAAVVVALMMCVSLFFKVDTVMVAGVGKYSENQVLDASGIEYGDSLLSLRKGTLASRIRYNLPHVEEVKIGIKLPGTVIIEVSELEAAYAIQTGSGEWWLVSASGRAVEQLLEPDPLGYPTILGVEVETPKTDQTVQAYIQIPETEETGAEETPEETGDTVVLPVDTDDTAQRLSAALTILQSLEENGGLGQMISLDVTDLSAITMTYEKRFSVKLGAAEELDYKIRYAISAISQLVSEGYDGGQLDMTFRYSDKPIFTPES